MLTVSVVIPTRNRAAIVHHAVRSALAQTYPYLEIVVCDDSSTDNTLEVVRSFGPKVRYVRTEGRLTMADTFEFALSKTSGDYVTFLTDTSYLFPRSVDEAIKSVREFDVRITMWRNCSYFTSDWFEPRRRNCLYVPSHTSNLYVLNSREILRKYLNNIREPAVPKSINSLCHRSVIEAAMSRQGRFFLPPCPDHASAVSMLVNTERFLLIDRPLFVASAGAVNIGASQSFNRGGGAEDFLVSFGRNLDEIAFLGIYTTSSLIVKSIQNVLQHYAGNEGLSVGIEGATREIVDSLAKLQVYGAKVDPYWHRLSEYSARSSTLSRVLTTRKIWARAKWSLVRLVRALPYWQRVEGFVKRSLVLQGSRCGFHNVEEAAQAASRHVQFGR